MAKSPEKAKIQEELTIRLKLVCALYKGTQKIIAEDLLDGDYGRMREFTNGRLNPTDVELNEVAFICDQLLSDQYKGKLSTEALGDAKQLLAEYREEHTINVEQAITQAPQKFGLAIFDSKQFRRMHRR